MKQLFRTLDRGEVEVVSRGAYEVVFSIFMIAVAYFYRDSPSIVYPRILYFFLLLLGTNFLFNYLLRRRSSVSLLAVDLMLLANIWIISGVLYYSGKGASYFWVLYLLPVFAASLLGSFKDALGVLLLCSLAIAALSWTPGGLDLARLLSLAVKFAVLAFSSGVVYSTAQSRKKAEAGLAAKRGEAEALAREVMERESEIVKTASAGEVGALVSGVMHDMGNAVTVILMSGELAAASETPKKKDLERIVKGAIYAKGLISAAMSIVRGQEYIFGRVQLAEAARSAELLTEYSARKQGAAVELDLPADLPPVRASRAHIERLLINSIFNSLSFLPEGGKVTVSARRAEGGVRLEITDNGPGFPENMLAEGVKAFATTRREKGGTGLGLFVCDQIARRHGGSLKLYNLPGGGAGVAVFLPLEGPGGEPEPKK